MRRSGHDHPGQNTSRALAGDGGAADAKLIRFAGKIPLPLLVCLTSSVTRGREIVIEPRSGA